MENLHKDLNPAQLEAVTAADGPLLVIAGAGSGKTRTIVHRLAYLVEQGIPARSLLLLTFTRKASQEMLHRASHLLNASLHDVCGGTFHAFAYRLLRRYAPSWAKGPVTILDSADSTAILKQCRDELGLAKGDRSFPKSPAILSLFSKARNKEKDLYDIINAESVHLLPHAEALNSLFSTTKDYRRAHNLLDYDDLLFECEALLQGLDAEGQATLPPLAQQMQHEFSHLLVDEYQDTNMVQARIVRLLAGERANVMAVGDDAQSIYAFRGATVRNILDFPRYFPNTRIIRLEENYRSDKPVLDVANAILSRAKEGYGKKLFTHRIGGKKVRLLRPMSDLSQAQVVARQVEELLHTYEPCEIAVLFRSGYQSYNVEVALGRLHIPFRKYGGLRYSEAAHIKDVLAYIRLCINPLDRPSFERVSALCKGIGPKTAHKIFESLCKQDHKALNKFLQKFPDMATDIALIDHIRQQESDLSLSLASVIEHYEKRLPFLFPDDYPRRMQGLEALAQIATGYADMQSFVADVSLDSPEEGHEDDDDGRKSLVLSTIHSAKGLEWKAVIVLDLVEDRFPSRHAMMRPDDFEEERRLMYVAVTRAQYELFLSAPLSVYDRKIKSAMPANSSAFIQDLPSSAYEMWQEVYGGLMRRQESPPPFGQSTQKINTTHKNFEEKADFRWTNNFPNTQKNNSHTDYDDEQDAENTDDFENAQQKNSQENCGFCQHAVFGKGKIVAHIPPDKCRVHFPGIGLKVILKAFLKEV